MDTHRLARCGRTLMTVTALITAAAACGSTSGSPASHSTSTTTTCPSVAPKADATVDWAVTGTSGEAKIVGATADTEPRIDIDAPFSVAETQVRTIRAGDGPVVTDGATVSICYTGVDGRTGKTFDSSYERGAPEEFSLSSVVPGFVKAIADQRTGSTVAVVMAPADGYPEGQPDAGIAKGDSLVFAISILSAS